MSTLLVNINTIAYYNTTTFCHVLELYTNCLDCTFVKYLETELAQPPQLQSLARTTRMVALHCDKGVGHLQSMHSIINAQLSIPINHAVIEVRLLEREAMIWANKATMRFRITL